MPAEAFFDTNVLIYAVTLDNAQDNDRSHRAETLLAAGGVVSVQVMNEFASVARRKLGMSWSEVKDALQAIRILCPAVAPLTLATHDLAIDLAGRYNFEIYDALIAAAALQAKSSVLYSEDFQDGQVIEGKLTIRNPFK